MAIDLQKNNSPLHQILGANNITIAMIMKFRELGDRGNLSG